MMRTHRLLFLFLFLLLPCLLTQCQSTQTIPPISSSVSFHQWSLSGKISVTTPEDSMSGQLNWDHMDRHYRLIFSHPLASQDWILVGTPHQVTLQYGQRFFLARTPEELLLTHFRWKLPLSSLNFWVQGRPDPQHPIHFPQYDSMHRYTSFEQRDCRVELLRYQNAHQYARPTLLKLSSDALTLKLSIHEWKFSHKALTPHPND